MIAGAAGIVVAVLSLMIDRPAARALLLAAAQGHSPRTFSYCKNKDQ
jgi:hypothetical protein